MQRLVGCRRTATGWMSLLGVRGRAWLCAWRPGDAAEPKWVSLFDGKIAQGLDGQPRLLARSRMATITGETTPGHMVEGNTFLI